MRLGGQEEIEVEVKDTITSHCVMGSLVQVFDEGWLSITNSFFGDWSVACIFGLCRPGCIAIQAALPCAEQELCQEGLVSFEVPGHKN